MSNKKEFPVLYKYTERKQIQQWQIIVEDDKFYTIEGIKEGKLTTSLPTICTGKNKSKKNETSGSEQALKEAKAKWKKKIEIDQYNEVLSSDEGYFKVMLASDLEGNNINFDAGEVYIQPKLDGLRSVNNTEGIFSRNGKRFRSVPHLDKESKLRLDGELYNHNLHDDFNKIVSLVKKQDPTKEELEESARVVQQWVYDYPDYPGTFSQRFEALKFWYESVGSPGDIVIVPTVKVKNWEEIEHWNKEWKAQGFEGTIIRLDALYENKRSKNLIKYKEFIDSEFEIIGYEEGKGSRVGTIGKFFLKHDKYPNESFDSNVKGDFTYLRQLWTDRDQYIGKSATVKYFNRTPRNEARKLTATVKNKGDVPRFPIIIKFDRNSYE